MLINGIWAKGVLPGGYILVLQEARLFPLTPNLKIDRVSDFQDRPSGRPSMVPKWLRGIRVSRRSGMSSAVISTRSILAYGDNFLRWEGILFSPSGSSSRSRCIWTESPVDAFLTHPSIEQLARYLGVDPVSGKKRKVAESGSTDLPQPSSGCARSHRALEDSTRRGCPPSMRSH